MLFVEIYSRQGARGDEMKILSRPQGGQQLGHVIGQIGTEFHFLSCGRVDKTETGRMQGLALDQLQQLFGPDPPFR